MLEGEEIRHAEGNALWLFEHQSLQEQREGLFPRDYKRREAGLAQNETRAD